LSNETDQRDALERRLLRYLLDHPAAADSIDGVRMWWLRDSVTSQADLQIVLDRLLQKGWIVTRGDRPEARIYTLNERERESAERFAAGESL
jgi:hypothetical protein